MGKDDSDSLRISYDFLQRKFEWEEVSVYDELFENKGDWLRLGSDLHHT